MTQSSPPGDWRAPTMEQIEALALEAFAEIPDALRRQCAGLVIQIADFPDEETLDEMGAETEYDLLGLFRGIGLAHSGGDTGGAQPNLIWLYRRPILDYWSQGEDTLKAVVAHVLIHEIGHHFGHSDADMASIEAVDPQEN